jgi:hypothetical protein
MLTDQPGWAIVEAALGTVTGPMPPSNHSAPGFAPLDPQIVLDVVLIAELVGVDTHAAGRVEQQLRQLLGLGQLAGRIAALFGCIANHGGLEVEMSRAVAAAALATSGGDSPCWPRSDGNTAARAGTYNRHLTQRCKSGAAITPKS